MKVIFDCGIPFFLAHGGSQTLAESLMRELRCLGLEVEPARWWDGEQTADVIHTIGRPSTLNTRLAHHKGMKVVFTDLLDEPASRGSLRLWTQRTFQRTAGQLLAKFTNGFNWEVYREADAMVFAVANEWRVAQYLFNADPRRGHVIPHGLDEAVLNELRQPAPESDYLISVATIDHRKNSVLLAEAARRAEIPVLFLGRPYAENDSYFARFKELIDDRFVRYAGFATTEEKLRLLRGARGFVLLSLFESGCIAVFEAAAAGLPLLLSDLPWARTSYPDARAITFARGTDSQTIAPMLRHFYDSAHRQAQQTFPVLPWRETADRYRLIYESIIA